MLARVKLLQEAIEPIELLMYILPYVYMKEDEFNGYKFDPRSPMLQNLSFYMDIIVRNANHPPPIRICRCHSLSVSCA